MANGCEISPCRTVAELFSRAAMDRVIWFDYNAAPIATGDPSHCVPHFTAIQSTKMRWPRRWLIQKKKKKWCHSFAAFRSFSTWILPLWILLRTWQCSFKQVCCPWGENLSAWFATIWFVTAFCSELSGCENSASCERWSLCVCVVLFALHCMEPLATH